MAMNSFMGFIEVFSPGIIIGCIFAVAFWKIKDLRYDYESFQKWDYRDIKADVKELCLKKYDYISKAEFQILLNNQYIHFEKKITDLEAEVKILKAKDERKKVD